MGVATAAVAVVVFAVMCRVLFDGAVAGVDLFALKKCRLMTR